MRMTERSPERRGVAIEVSMTIMTIVTTLK